mmetsp:Transcript_75045/g.160785  ORF Transcript_75045/g.160785 Transcript_75045/m.160785 type:complete len:204 (-) Transcript_75045:618-1229(-)
MKVFLIFKTTLEESSAKGTPPKRTLVEGRGAAPAATPPAGTSSFEGNGKVSARALFRSSSWLCANLHKASWQAPPASTTGQSFVREKSGSACTSSTLWAKLQDPRFRHLPAKWKEHSFVLCNLFLLTFGVSTSCGAATSKDSSVVKVLGIHVSQSVEALVCRLRVSAPQASQLSVVVASDHRLPHSTGGLPSLSPLWGLACRQ